MNRLDVLLRPGLKSTINTQLYHLEKSAMAEHSINLDHCIQFHDISILAKKSGYMECLIREVIEIGLQPDDINREEGFSLNRSWKPLIQILKEQKNSCFDFCPFKGQHLSQFLSVRMGLYLYLYSLYWPGLAHLH